MIVKEREARERLHGIPAGPRAMSVVSPRPESLTTLRGYPVGELCRRHTFEEVAYLLWHGELPTRDELVVQNRVERAQRALEPAIAASIIDQPFAAHPMDVLHRTVTSLGVSDPAKLDVSPAALRTQALRVFAALPSIIAMDYRRRHGLGPVMPRSHLSYAANFLCMTFGKVPEPQIVAAFETSLILSAGHGLDDSAFTARTVTSAIPDVYGGAVAGIEAVKSRSPLAGSSGGVMEMLNEIAIPDNARTWVDEALAGDRKIMGFGPCVHRDGDSRVGTMRGVLSMIAALRGRQDVLESYDALASAMYEATGLYPNLEYPLSLAYRLIGFDAPALHPIFVAACLPAWT